MSSALNPTQAAAMPAASSPASAASVASLSVGGRGVVVQVGGERLVRRRLMELGLVPGTEVRVVNVAPLGDPLELVVRGCRLSIRRQEAEAIELRDVVAHRRLEMAP